MRPSKFPHTDAHLYPVFSHRRRHIINVAQDVKIDPSCTLNYTKPHSDLPAIFSFVQRVLYLRCYSTSTVQPRRRIAAAAR